MSGRNSDQKCAGKINDQFARRGVISKHRKSEPKNTPRQNLGKQGAPSNIGARCTGKSRQFFSLFEDTAKSYETKSRSPSQNGTRKIFPTSKLEKPAREARDGPQQAQTCVGPRAVTRPLEDKRFEGENSEGARHLNNWSRRNCDR